jgi:hypothetical protein
MGVLGRFARVYELGAQAVEEVFARHGLQKGEFAVTEYFANQSRLLAHLNPAERDTLDRILRKLLHELDTGQGRKRARPKR